MGAGGHQETLFEVAEDARALRGAEAAAAAGITYRQLDYWARTDLVAPSLRAACGSGTVRLYTVADVVALSIVKRLLAAGVALASIRTAVRALRVQPPARWRAMTLVSDGVQVQLYGSRDEVMELLGGGRVVIGLALERVWSEILDRLEDTSTDQPVPSRRPALRVVS